MAMESRHKSQMWCWIAFWIMLGLILINVHWANTLTKTDVKTEHKFTIEVDDEVVQIMQMAYNVSNDDVYIREREDYKKTLYIMRNTDLLKQFCKEKIGVEGARGYVSSSIFGYEVNCYNLLDGENDVEVKTEEYIEWYFENY